MKGPALVLAAVIAVGCTPARTPEAPAPAPLPSAPWSGAAVNASDVPAIYARVWRDAANRGKCALLAPQRIDDSRGAQARAATFSGGWAVAYDEPDMRSAFGVAGSGSSAWSPDIYQDWPHKIVYADSSRAGYGREGGGAGPNWLAYLQIPGQDCLYNVWSRHGREHLEALLTQLRFVRVP